VFDVVGLQAGEALDEPVERAFDGFGVAFEGRLAPAVVAFCVTYLDEEPAGHYSEVLDAFDWSHGGWSGRSSCLQFLTMQPIRRKVSLDKT